MKGLTFANFTADENNQAAYDASRKVAFLKGEPGKPVTLVGEKGTGKSHLLWAIVNEYRERQARVSVALISAGDFPRKVRSLSHDPTPIMKNRPAVLLVDELERFRENLPELEAVVRAFLDNGHAVVLATRIHPSVLPGYSGKFKALLTSGSILGMQATGATSADGGMPTLALERIAGLKQTIHDLEQERDRLKRQMRDGAIEGTRAVVPSAGTAQIEAERDRTRIALERSEGDLFETRQELASAREAADKAGAELDMSASLVKALSEKLAEVEAAQRSRIEALDQALAGLDRDLEALAEDGPTGGGPALAAYDSLVAEKHSAEARLDAARRETAQSMARASVWAGEVQRLLERAAALLLMADEGPAVAEARKNVSDAMVRLVRVFGGAPGAEPDKMESGILRTAARRAMPGGAALTDVVKKAFGDPVDDDDDSEDFTYAEPAPEEDESDTDLDGL